MSKDIAHLFEPSENPIAVLDEVTRTYLLGQIEDIGGVEEACAMANITPSQYADALAADPMLETDVQMSQARYRADLLRRMKHLALEGYEKSIVGGKEKDTILGHDVVPEPKAMELLAKIHFADALAIVTRQRITKTDVSAQDSVKADFSSLGAKDRKDLERILMKTQVGKVLEDKSEEE